MIFIARVGIGVTAAAAIACSATACSSSTSQQKSAGGATVSASPGRATSASQATAGSSSTVQSTALPDTTLSVFLTSVVKGDVAGACDVTAELSNDGTLMPPSAGNCAAAAANAQFKATFATIEKAVTPTGADGGAPVVAITGVSAVGDATSVMPSQITIDHQSLQDILSANHGPGSAAITSFQLRKIGNLWYVVTFL